MRNVGGGLFTTRIGRSTDSDLQECCKIGDACAGAQTSLRSGHAQIHRSTW